MLTICLLFISYCRCRSSSEQNSGCGAATACPYGTHEVTSVLVGFELFVPLFFLFWALYCLFSFDLLHLITPFGIFKLFLSSYNTNFRKTMTSTMSSGKVGAHCSILQQPPWISCQNNTFIIVGINMAIKSYFKDFKRTPNHFDVNISFACYGTYLFKI